MKDVKREKHEEFKYVDYVFDSGGGDVGHLLSVFLDIEGSNLVALSLDGVVFNQVVDMANNDIIEDIFLRFGGDKMQLNALYTKLVGDVLKGKYKAEALLGRLTRICKERPDEKVLQNFILRHYRPELGFNLAKELKAIGWDVIMQGNISALGFQHLKQRYKLDDFGGKYFCSFDHGTIKPEQGFFEGLNEYCDEQTGWFVDVSLPNLEQAKDAGWKTIWIR